MGQHSWGLSQASGWPPSAVRGNVGINLPPFQKAAFWGSWIDPSPLLTPNWPWRRWSSEGSHLGALPAEVRRSGKLGEEGAGPLLTSFVIRVKPTCFCSARVIEGNTCSGDWFDWLNVTRLVFLQESGAPLAFPTVPKSTTGKYC